MSDFRFIVGIMFISALLVAGLTYLATYEASPQQLLVNESGQIEDYVGPLTAEEQEVVNVNITNSMNPIAIFDTNKGEIKIELFADQMPITVGNFVTLAAEGFYDGTKFHRVIPGFMIQGGDPESKGTDSMPYGTGGPGYTIQDEFVEGELLTNKRGTIAMANTGQPNSGGSQWFINIANNQNLDFNQEPLTSKHPVFGQVIAGMDVVDAIAAVETDARDVPTEPVVINAITIADADKESVDVAAE